MMADPYVNLDRFKSVVEERFGLVLHEQQEHLERIVRQRMEATSCADFGAYERLLSSPGASNGELRAVAEALTVGETHFFRNEDHFNALVEHALPARLREGNRPVRVLSVGCSSGEEPYTIGILLRERFSDLGSADVVIVGVDVNPAAVAKARRAHYSAWSLRKTSTPIRDRYFRAVGSELALADEIRRAVTFEERNLFESENLFWAPASFDIVFCRNVVIYFGPEKLAEAIARLTRVLRTGGFLFLGHSESLRGMTDDFDLLQTHGTFYYQRRDPSRPKPEAAAGASWTAPIERASWRVRQITSRPPPPDSDGEAAAGRAPLGGAHASPGSAGAANLDLAMELYRQERFADALELLAGLPPRAAAEPSARLLIAAILTNQGELQSAETICREVLASDDLNAGAHYLTALARERAGDREGAIRHDQMAAYVDPSFAMPHLHMGMLARHAGDLPTARRELAQAVTLLLGEDSERIVLFGGGFSREALARLCRAELEAAGGKS